MHTFGALPEESIAAWIDVIEMVEPAVTVRKAARLAVYAATATSTKKPRKTWNRAELGDLGYSKPPNSAPATYSYTFQPICASGSMRTSSR